jgi:hypothetical protein
MKIIYFGNHENKGSDFTEIHIKYALEKLGHKVFCVDENNWAKDNVVNLSRGADLFLFHKAGVKEQKTYQRFMDLLVCITCKKVCWYFDKVWGEREIVLQAIIPFIDKLFLTDETWARKHNYKNIEILHQGIGIEDTSLGTPREDLKTDIAFVGMVYGERQRFIEKLLEKYGDKLRVFGNIFNRDLYDLCASTKIVVAPDSPSDDFYWSSRVYMILGSGGFLIHPKCEGLKEEYTHKEELVTYSDFDDLLSKIDFYLVNDKKRKAIQKKGYEKTIKSFNYLERCKTLLEKSFIGKNA